MTKRERNAKIIEALDERAKRARQSKAYARKLLVQAGIYTEDGKLTKEFGGEAKDPKDPKKAA